MNFVDPLSSVIGAADPRSSRAPHKWPISYRSVGAIAIASDVATILVCGIGSGVAYHFESYGITDVVPQYLGAASVVAAFYVLVMKGNDLYKPTELLALRTQIRSVASIWLGVFLFLSGAVFALKIGDHFSRGAILSFAALGLVLLLAERVFYRVLLTRGLEGHRFAGRNVALITDGTPSADMNLPILLKHGYRIQHRHVLAVDQQNKEDQERSIAEIVSDVRGSSVEEIIVSVDLQHWEELRRVFSSLRALPLAVSFIPVGPTSDFVRRPSHLIGKSTCIEIQRAPLDALERGLKRSIDVFCALVGLILSLPLLSIIAVMIKLDSPGPVLFRQKRCGFNGRPFDIYKFRTMSVLENGPAIDQATPLDSRVTRLGRQLRRASIDELPQLLNVLNGSMSLVGPRPHALAHDTHFDKIVSNYAFRHHVKPGLTGWAQVNGYRGPTPNVADIRHRVEYDLWYIDNWSLRLDLLILIRTIFEVLRGRNAV